MRQFILKWNYFNQVEADQAVRRIQANLIED